jgi:hypothetical protein
LEGQRVNRVAVLLQGDGAIVSLYRTNTKLGEVTNLDLAIPNFKASNMPNKMVYMNYCRDFMINLLENGGVEGYYYEAKQTIEDDGRPKKYDKSTFEGGAYNTLVKVMDNILNSSAHIKYEIMRHDTQVEVTEKYKDNYVKYAKADFSVSLESGDKCEVIIVPVYMKSGQMCKPKTIIHDGIERSLNMTTINSIMRGQDKPINVREAILKKIAENALDVPVPVNNVPVDTNDVDNEEDNEVEQA